MNKIYMAAVLIILSFLSIFSIESHARPAQKVVPQDSRKYHLIMWHTTWCGPCRVAERDLDKDPDYLALNPEKIDPENDLKTDDEKLFYETENVTGFPTFVLYTEVNIRGQIWVRELGRFEGYKNKRDFFNKVENIKNKYKNTKENN